MEITDKNKNILAFLLFIPLLLSLFLHGGYFRWEKYFIFLTFIPFLFYYSFQFSDYFFSLREKGFSFLFIYFIVACLSVIGSVNKGASIEKCIEILFFLIFFYFVANAIYNGFIKKTQIKKFIIFAGIVGSIMSIISIVILKNTGGVSLSKTILEYISSHIVTSNTQSASAFFGYRNTFGAFMCIPFFILFGTNVRGKGKLKIIFKYLLLTLFTFTIFLSQSRFAIIIFLLLFVLFPIFSKKENKKESFIYAGSIIATVLLTSIFNNQIFVKYLADTIDRFTIGFNYIMNTEGKIFDVSIFGRIEMIKYSFNIFKSHMLLGTGRGTYPFIYTLFRTNGLYAEDPHSFILLLMSESGILGILSAVFIFIFFLINRNKNETGMFFGLSAILLHMFLDFDNQFVSINLIILLIGASLLYDEIDIKLKQASSWNNGIKMLITFLVIMAMPMTSAFYYKNFMYNYDLNPKKAYEDITQAVSRFSISSEYNYQMGKYILSKIVMEKDGYDTKLAELGKSYYERAIELSPTYWKYYEALGDYYMGIGENKQAIPILEKGLTYNKYEPQCYFKLSECYQGLNNPQMEEFYKNLGMYYLKNRGY